jgi:hypothetical protein
MLSVDEFFVEHYHSLLKFCTAKWNGNGQDVLHTAYELISSSGYEYCTFTLFCLKAAEAARNLLKVQKRELPYDALPVAIPIVHENICEVCGGRILCEQCDESHLRGLLYGQLSLPFTSEPKI